jgi:hypothetical protein
MYGYEMNTEFSFTPILTLLPLGNNNSNCFDPTTTSTSSSPFSTNPYSCVYDFSNYFDSTNCRCTNASKFFSVTAVGNSCSQANNCSGSN